MKNPIIILALSSFFIVATTACADQSAEDASHALCELYKPDNWGAKTQGGGKHATDLQNIYAKIVQRQQSEITNQKILAVLATADDSSFPDYHTSVSQGISKALGEPWLCEFFDDFFFPQQNIAFIKIKNSAKKRVDPQGDNVITLMFASNGTVLINNAPLDTADSKTIQAALKAQPKFKSSDTDIFLYFDFGADAGKVGSIIDTLALLGVEEVGVIYLD